MNLVFNARDAMPSGGTLRVDTAAVEIDEAFVRTHPGSTAGSFARLIVSDTGHGMTPEVQAQIFTPFFTTKTPSGGTGLGLAIVHGIVEQWGGWIAVESTIGQGTRFSIYFPRCTPAAGSGTTAAVSAVADASSGTILFVEDDECIRTLGTRMLRQKGFSVLPARHAAEALDLAADHERRIDLLLTDIVMPGLSGRELAARLIQTRPDLKVLYTSGYSDDVAAVQEVNGPAFIRKPYAPDALVRQIRAVLAAD
jgi:CheY-like chemotaxis protein